MMEHTHYIFPARGYRFDGVVLESANTNRGIKGVWRPRRFFSDKAGYLGTTIVGDGKRIRVAYHRLVCEWAHGPCPDGMECCHNDGDVRNNSPDNLRWDTPKNNRRDTILHGRNPRQDGENNPLSKLMVQDIVRIREMLASGRTHQSIADEFGVLRQTIGKISSRQRWGHVV